MSLANVPHNQFDFYNRFPDGQDLTVSPYQLSTTPFDFLHGVSHLSSALDMAALSPDELERFQKLSNEFEPDVQVGSPVVGS